MIRQNSFSAAVAVAASYAAKGQTLVAQPGTLLSELLTQSTPGATVISQEIFGKCVSTIESYGMLMWMTSEDHSDSPSKHSLTQGAAVDQIAPLFKNHIAFARNTVKPLVVELGGILEARQQELKAIIPGTDLNVIVKSLPEILGDESFLDTLRYYKDRTPSEPKNYLNLGPRTKEEIVALMLTGHQRTDTMIAEWVSHLPDGFLRKVWSSYFDVSVDKEEIFNSVSIGEMTAYDRLDFALAVYLIGRKIYDDVQTTDISLDRYKNISLDIRDYAGDVLVTNLQFVYRMIESKVLVLGSSLFNKTITVNGELYNDWLAAGGKPEVLLGMLLTNNIATTIEVIDANAEKHMRSWNAHLMFQNTDNSNKYFDNLRVATLSAFAQQLAVEDPTESPINQTNTNRRTELEQKAQEYLELLNDDQLKDAYSVALYLVGKIRFGYTNAYQILSDIADACKANPDVDVREAALLAAINCLGDFFADQISVVRAA